jgi:hypothetical protein
MTAGNAVPLDETAPPDDTVQPGTPRLEHSTKPTRVLATYGAQWGPVSLPRGARRRAPLTASRRPVDPPGGGRRSTLQAVGEIAKQAEGPLGSVDVEVGALGHPSVLLRRGDRHLHRGHPLGRQGVEGGEGR